MADTSIDLAHGLGEQVYVMGLSGGGGVASWVAQYRPDVERVVSIAPFYALGLLPPWLSQWATNLLTRLPNIPARAPSPIEYQYQGMSSKGVGESMRFAQVARQGAATSPMAAGTFLLVTNENDVAVSNRVARQVNEMRRGLGAEVDEFIFDKEYGLPHDVIDVHQPTSDPEFVYPILIDLMEGRAPTLP
jgi:pimeloyl-ACP methyl ester carboxylesterase